MSTFDRAALLKALENLGSAEAHQALAAAKLATSLLRDAGLGWSDVLQAEIRPRIAGGAGPFGYRREQRELSPHEQFFMVLLSPRTPIRSRTPKPKLGSCRQRSPSCSCKSNRRASATTVRMSRICSGRPVRRSTGRVC